MAATAFLASRDRAEQLIAELRALLKSLCDRADAARQRPRRREGAPLSVLTFLLTDVRLTLDFEEEKARQRAALAGLRFGGGRSRGGGGGAGF